MYNKIGRRVIMSNVRCFSFSIYLGFFCWFWAEVCCTLFAIGDDQWPVRSLGESYNAEAWGHCMKVWSIVVQRELNSLSECLLVCNLVVIEWMTAITGDCVGLFWDFSLRRKIWRTIFDEAAPETLIIRFVFLSF
jgi:hypothetical protein